jgi:ABC-2 type transport system ATP-binding protein
VIEVTELSKSYGSIQALDNVSLRVDEGEVVGLLGPNGAGKTTLMKIMTGYLQPDRGHVVVDGLDVVSDTLKVQERIGYLPENAPLYPELSVQAYLKIMADLRQVPRKAQPELISKAVRATGLEDMLARPISQLSKGYRQRVGLTQSIFHRPKVLILDEPTIGLDPTQIIEVRGLIGELAKHSTVFLSTHILSEVEALCDRAVIIMQGRIRADADLETLAAGTAVLLTLSDEVEGARKRLLAIPGVASVERERDRRGIRYRITAGAAVDELGRSVFDTAAAGGWPVSELRQERRTLETVFDALARGADAAEADE